MSNESKEVGMIEDSLAIETPRGRKRVVAESTGEKRIKIILEENEAIPPTGQFFGHNGDGFYLRAGEVAEVPERIINILNDSEMKSPVVDPGTKQVVDWRPRLRYPYRIVA